MKKIITLLAALILCIGFVVPSYGDDVISNARQSVAVVCTEAKTFGDWVWISHGTCFFVGKSGSPVEYCVTNYHVIEDYLKNPSEMRLSIFISSNSYYTADIITYNQQQDFAILKLQNAKTNLRKPLKLRSPKESITGDQMFCVGYPALSDDGFDSISRWGVDDSLVSKGTVGRLLTESNGTKWIQSSDISWSGGSSGGPLLLEDGSVIGLVRGTVNSLQEMNAKIFYGVDISAVIPSLNSYGIPYETVGASQGTASDEKTTLIATLLAMAVVFFWLKKRKIQKTPVICALSPQHGGVKVSVGTNPIKIGRDSSCKIRFKDDTPKVSRSHCAISYNEKNKVFTLIDLGSSYGTFLATGHKLTPNKEYRLSPGDSFYVGEKIHQFKLGFVEKKK